MNATVPTLDDERCAQCGRLLHPDAHISDACEHCGHVAERAAELRLEQPFAALFGDEEIPF